MAYQRHVENGIGQEGTLAEKDRDESCRQRLLPWIFHTPGAETAALSTREPSKLIFTWETLPVYTH